MKPSNASSLVKYAIRDVVLEAQKEERKGKEIIYLNIGDPAKYDFSPPQAIIDGVEEALRGPYKGYAPSTGDPELREEVAKLERCSPEEVFITAGLSEGVDFGMRILLDAGDSVLLPNPVYPLYATKVDVLGAKSHFYECGEGWVPDPDDIRKRVGGKTKAIVVINPNNPTGAVYPRKALEEIAGIAAENDLAIFADEVYDHLIFEDAEMHKMKDIAKDCVVFSGNSISKNFLYPGARVGYVAIHHDREGEFLDAFTRVCNQRLSVNWEFQRGAIAAYRGGFGFLEPELKKLRERRDILCRRAGEIPGLSVFPAKAALYGFVKVEGYRGTDWDFTYDLLRTEGVLVVPGSAFYKNHPDELYFRTTLLPDEETLEKAMGKLENFMKKRIA
jgi:alanine-synthesizing transaminase